MNGDSDFDFSDDEALEAHLHEIGWHDMADLCQMADPEFLRRAILFVRKQAEATGRSPVPDELLDRVRNAWAFLTENPGERFPWNAKAVLRFWRELANDNPA